MSEPMRAFATRLPASEAELVQNALDETGWTKSKLLRRAARHYVRTNPDEITVLYPPNSAGRMMAELTE